MITEEHSHQNKTARPRSMIKLTRQIQFVVLMSLAPTLAIAAPAQQRESTETSNGTADVADQATSELSKDETLKWLDEYLTKQILFRKEDVAAIRKKVEDLKPEELKAWLGKTREIREILESPEWRRTNIWLMSYMPQFFSTDQQMEEFRAKSAQMTPEELHDMLDRLKQKHETMMSMHSSMYAVKREQRAREQRSSVETEQRKATNQAWSNYSQNQAQQAEASRRQARSGRPFYGSNQTHASRRSRESRRISQPLISSEDAARGVVRRSVYGGYGYRW